MGTTESADLQSVTGVLDFGFCMLLVDIKKFALLWVSVVAFV